MTPARAPRIRRWGRWVVLTLAGAITVMMVALVIGMVMDDRAIDRDKVRAVATVLNVSALRTGVEFVDQEGVAIRPAAGVLYPGALSLGQRFMVEYSALDPEIARVAGRSARHGLRSVAFVLVPTWLIAALLLALGGLPTTRLGRSRVVG